MDIEHLNWDTDFFGYPVGKVRLTNENEINFADLENDKHRLLYILSDNKLGAHTLGKLGVIMADEKVELTHYLPSTPISNHNNTHIVNIARIDDAIIALALQSGVYSRFYTDANFHNNEFERLYTAWIKRSVEREIADEVYGFLHKNRIIGVITISTHGSMPNIGLLAVDKEYRERNIGGILLNRVMQYVQLCKCDTLSVVTQGSNLPALNFYKKNGFTVASNIYIYHLWK